MPRNNAGSYTLPSGTPYVTRTTASATIVNSVNSDMATELTNSLDRNGRGQMLAPLPLADGTVTAPGLSFSAEPASGLFRAGANDIRLAVGGNSVLQATAAGAFALLGLTVTTTVTNGAAVTGTGNGTGGGLVGVGGSGGAPGVSGTGTIAAPGVAGTGGPSNGVGVLGTGAGNAQGGSFVGAGSAEGLIATPGTSSTNAINAVGNILLTGATLAGAPNVSVGGPSTVTYATAVRVGGSFGIVKAVGAQSIKCSYNIASVVLAANKTDLVVTFANYVATSATSYWVNYAQDNLGVVSGGALGLRLGTRTTTSLSFQLINTATGGVITDITSLLFVPTIDFEVKGF